MRIVEIDDRAEAAGEHRLACEPGLAPLAGDARWEDRRLHLVPDLARQSGERPEEGMAIGGRLGVGHVGVPGLSGR